MQLYERLGIPCGVTAVIGSGGKTTLLRTLSRELPGTVILTTTTHILPFEGVPLLTAPTEDEVRAALSANGFEVDSDESENGWYCAAVKAKRDL